MKSKKVFISVSYVTVGLILGKLTSFIKHAIIVKYAGINFDADVFFVANTISETSVNIILAGLVGGALIPVATEIFSKFGEDTFEKFVKSVFYIVGLILIFIAGLIFFFSSQISSVIAPGYEASKHLISSNILKLLAPGILFIGLAAILRGVMQARENFLVPALGPFIANMVTITVIVIYFDRWGIYAAAVGTSLGFLLWFISHIPKTLKYLKPVHLSVRANVYLQKLAKLSVPTISIIFIGNFVMLMEKFFASNFVEGTVTQLNLAFRLALIFSNILILPLGTVLLPKLSKKFGKNDIKGLLDTASNAFLYVTVVLYCILIVLVLNVQLITKTIYGPTGISAAELTTISQFLLVYSLAYFGLFYYLVQMRIFFSVQSLATLVKGNLIGLVLYSAIVICLENMFGKFVLPLAYSFFYIATSQYLFWKLRRYVAGEKLSFINKSITLTGLIILLLIIISEYFFTWIGQISVFNITISIFAVLIFLYISRRKDPLVSANFFKK